MGRRGSSDRCPVAGRAAASLRAFSRSAASALARAATDGRTMRCCTAGRLTSLRAFCSMGRPARARLAWSSSTAEAGPLTSRPALTRRSMTSFAGMSCSRASSLMRFFAMFCLQSRARRAPGATRGRSRWCDHRCAERAGEQSAVLEALQTGRTACVCAPAGQTPGRVGAGGPVDRRDAEEVALGRAPATAGAALTGAAGGVTAPPLPRRWRPRRCRRRPRRGPPRRPRRARARPRRRRPRRPRPPRAPPRRRRPRTRLVALGEHVTLASAAAAASAASSSANCASSSSASASTAAIASSDRVVLDRRIRESLDLLDRGAARARRPDRSRRGRAPGGP